MLLKQVLNKFQLSFDSQLEAEYADRRFVEGRVGFSMVLWMLVIINPPLMLVEYIRLDNPTRPILLRTALEILLIFILFLNYRIKNLNYRIYPYFYSIPALLIYLLIIAWSHTEHLTFYALFLPNITVVNFFVNASFTGLKFKQSALVNSIIIGLYIAYSYGLSQEQLHIDQIPSLISLFIVCLLVSYLLERFNRRLFLNHQEIKKKNKIIEQINEELIDRNELKNSLISVLSHDINSPLFSIKSLIQLIKEKELPREEMLKYWNHIDQSVDRVLGFTAKTIEWVKKQMDSFRPNIQPCNVLSITKEITHLCHAQAQIKSVKLSYDIKDSDEIHADEEVIRIGLRNLISNAIKFSHEGREVEVVGTQKEDEYLLSVRDHGKGISKERQELLFSTHMSEPGTKNEEGSGLGLSFANMLMQQLGGRIDVKSEINKGSSFTMVFPTPSKK